MLSIVGTRIYFHKGDSFAFKVASKDSETGDIVEFLSTDTLTFRVYRRDTDELVLSKIAEAVKFEGKDIQIITFKDVDTINLTPGDYSYSLLLESHRGLKYTLIHNANLTILDMNFQDMHTESTESDIVYLSNTQLICSFDHKRVIVDESDGTLIIF